MQPNVQKTIATSTNSGHQQLQPLDKALKKFEKHIELGQYEGPGKLQNRAISTLIQTNKKLEAQRIRVKDKSDRATIEQVLDPRTRMILFKLLSRSAILCTCMRVHVCVYMYVCTCIVCTYMYVLCTCNVCTCIVCICTYVHTCSVCTFILSTCTCVHVLYRTLYTLYIYMFHLYMYLCILLCM